MRLTLRTLLAYLDDTLEPGEIKNIGQKVSESDQAQELINRIRQVTRRRRLTVPPDIGPDQAFDANRVAAYLDNDLSPEEVAELEKLCLESDVHLAEASACHQILTLVLGEPALIPPTARRRMYALLQGRASKAVKTPAVIKATTADRIPANSSAASATQELDPDDSLMALPLFRNLPWLRWALPLGAVVLLVVLGVIMFVRPGGGPGPGVTRRNEGGSNGDANKDVSKSVSDTKKSETIAAISKTTEVTQTSGGGSSKTTEPATTNSGVRPIPPVDKPSTERHAVGLFSEPETVLARQTADGWKRVGIRDQVQTGELLVSLPGFKSVIQFDRKIDLLLWGNLPETQLESLPLLESAVTINHVPNSGVLDADVTVHRGRIYITNKKDKGPAHIRLRFWRDEVWDVTLDEPGGKFGFEVQSSYLPELKPREGEEPVVASGFYLLNGTGSLRTGYRYWGDLKGPLGKAIFLWNNKEQLTGPHFIENKIPLWDEKQLPPREQQAVEISRRLSAAVRELAGALGDPSKKVTVALQEFMEEKKQEKRYLGIRCLGALDAVPDLLDTLGKEDVDRFDMRQEALFSLRNWLARSNEQGAKLYDSKTRSGLLIDKGYTNQEADIILGLLYGPSSEERKQRDLYELLISYLMHRKLFVRELAVWHLHFLTRNEFKISYNPAAPEEVRARGYEAWKKVLDMGKLPPAPPPPPPPKPEGN